MISDSVSLWGVYSVWYRHAKRFRESWKVNFIPPISEPLIYLLAFGYGLGPLVKEVSYGGQSVPYFSFIAAGMMGIGILFQSFMEAAYGTYIRIRYHMTWQAMLTAPLTFTEVFFGELLWAASRGILAGVLTGLTAAALGAYPLKFVFAALPLIVLGSLMFAAMGMWAAGLVAKIDQLNVPVFLLITPMFAFCGTYFPRTTLPVPVNIFAGLLPLSPLVDLLRWPIARPEHWMFLVCVLMLWFAIFAFLAHKRLLAKLYQ